MSNLKLKPSCLLFLLSSIFFYIVFVINLNAQPNSPVTEKANQNTTSPDSASEILSGNSPKYKLFILRKFNFINNALHEDSTTNSALSFELKSNKRPLFYLTPEELHKITPQGNDPLWDEIRRRYIDIPPTLPLNNAIRSLVESFKTSPQEKINWDMPIPTDIEIDVLKILWSESSATSSEIYAHLDSLAITAEDLQELLQTMSERGFLSRKKISPSHKFGLFGITSIEVSSLNRKNPLYLYWPNVSKDKLLTFLDARRYLALSANSTVSTNGHTNELEKSLEAKLYRLVQ